MTFREVTRDEVLAALGDVGEDSVLRACVAALRVHSRPFELWKLAGIEKTDWVQRRTLKVGNSANAPVWWNERDGTVPGEYPG